MFVYVLGLILITTVIAAPVGVGLLEFGNFLFWPFGNAMVSKKDLNIEQNQTWKTFSTIIMILYLPFGLILCIMAVFQVAGLFISIIGIPAALVIAKSMGTYLNPVNKKCVHSAVAEELDNRKAKAAVDAALS